MAYKVWLAIEHEDRHGNYTEMDCPGASLSVFSRYDSAYNFAAELTCQFEDGTWREVETMAAKAAAYDKLMEALRFVAARDEGEDVQIFAKDLVRMHRIRTRRQSLPTLLKSTGIEPAAAGL